jgi:hypothetical protein
MQKMRAERWAFFLVLGASVFVGVHVGLLVGVVLLL